MTENEKEVSALNINIIKNYLRDGPRLLWIMKSKNPGLKPGV